MKRKLVSNVTFESQAKVLKQIPTTIQNLPSDTLLHIFQYLHNFREVFRVVSKTCKVWYLVLQENEHTIFNTIDIAHNQLAMLRRVRYKSTTVTENEILSLLELCKNQKIKQWNFRKVRRVKMTEKILQTMLDYNMFNGIEVLSFTCDNSSEIVTLMEQVAKQCSGSLKELDIQVDNWGSSVCFLNECADTLEKYTCYNEKFDNLSKNLVLPNLQYFQVGRASFIDNLIPKCPNLVELAWPHGEMSPISVEQIQLLAKYCHNFNKITLGARYLKELELITTSCVSFPSLKELTITDGYYYDNELQDVGKICKKLEKFVDETESGFDAYTYEELLRDIGSTIKYLDIRLPYETPAETFEELPSLCPNLQYLSLSRMFGYPNVYGVYKEKGSKLIDFFDKFTNLNTLRLSIRINRVGKDDDERESRKQVINGLIKVAGLRDRGYLSQEPVVIEFEDACLYSIRNVHPTWNFDIRIIDAGIGTMVMEVIKK
jgi:hypothetical protein